MTSWIPILNGAAVSLFGTLLAASFCNMSFDRRNCCYLGFGSVFLLLLQAVVYGIWDFGFLRGIYPVVVHLPLLGMLCLFTRRLLWPAISILTAYLCCQTRRWLALAVTAACSGGHLMQQMVELMVTVPLLILLLQVVSPAVRPLAIQPIKTQVQFGVIPALYYGFDYMTRVYTELLSSGAPVAVEFMPFVCCGAYLSFLLVTNSQQQREARMEALQHSLDGQLSQAVREIQSLRENQEQARQYRHDLRHHMQYLAACLENGQYDQAQTYISGIFRELERQKLRRFCENETANLILSAFFGRAEKAGIRMEIQSVLPGKLPVLDQDLCVVLSNALENAIHACGDFRARDEESTIEVQLFLRENRVFFQVTNPCRPDIRFHKGIPVTSQPGHGTGVQSICTVVERYGGIWDFQVQNGRFRVRLTM